MLRATLVLAYYGINTTEEAVAQQLGTTEYGRLPAPAGRLLRLSISKRTVALGPSSLEILRASLLAGNPVIALVNTQFLDYWHEETAHAVVVVGFDDTGVLLNDPAFDDAPKHASIDGFLAAWGEYDFQSAVFVEQ